MSTEGERDNKRAFNNIAKKFNVSEVIRVCEFEYEEHEMSRSLKR